MGKYKVIWRKKARRQYLQYLIYAQVEFGSKAFFRWTDSVHKMEEVLSDNPRQYGRVLQLRNKQHEFRGHNVMEHFKIIYAFDEDAQVVNIVTIWDMRMNPKKLFKMIK